jgi:hypothetical protein
MRVRPPAAPRARPTVRLRIPADRVGGRAPRLRVRSTRAARGTVTLRRAPRAARATGAPRRATGVGRFAVGARRGWTTVRVPGRIARRLTAGRYSVRVRLAGRSVGGVLRVVPRARR